MAIASLRWGYYIDPNGKLGILPPDRVSGKPSFPADKTDVLGTAIKVWNGTPGNDKIDME